jgi:hypothetical protein
MMRTCSTSSRNRRVPGGKPVVGFVFARRPDDDADGAHRLFDQIELPA